MQEKLLLRTVNALFDNPPWKHCGLLAGILLNAILLSGCLSPLAIHKAVIEYDRTVSQVESEMLLLNVARTRHFHPTHFTALSSVAATFEFQAAAGFAAAGSNTESLVAPVFGISSAEKPTMTIIPIQGEEFTTRILTPFDEKKIAFLFQQRVEPALLLRLMSSELILNGYGEVTLLRNQPHRMEEYKEFRRRVLHLSSLNQSRELFVGPIVYEQVFPFSLSRSLSNQETLAGLGILLQAAEKGYQWTQQGSQGELSLSRHVVSRVAITNYDPSILTNQERQELALDIEKYPQSTIFVDIRPGAPGGDYPMRGVFTIRSFHTILQFLALGIAADPEYHVEKDPRTSSVSRNPPWTIAIEETEEKPQNATFAVTYKDRWYSIRNAPKNTGPFQPWNQVAFRILGQLYQMTVTELSRTPTPAITIAK